MDIEDFPGCLWIKMRKDFSFVPLEGVIDYWINKLEYYDFHLVICSKGNITSGFFITYLRFFVFYTKDTSKM